MSLNEICPKCGGEIKSSGFNGNLFCWGKCQHYLNETEIKELRIFQKDIIFREARKLVDTLNRFGNCLVPSIHEDGSDTTAQERLRWLLDETKNHFGISLDEIQTGIDTL